MDTPVFPLSEHHTQQIDRTVSFVCWDEIKNPQCPKCWAELQAHCRWRLSTPGSSQSTTLYLVAYLLPTHVAFLGNKQLFYELPPTEAKGRCCRYPMRDIRCYLKSIFSSTLKLIGKSFFCAHILHD